MLTDSHKKNCTELTKIHVQYFVDQWKEVNFPDENVVTLDGPDRVAY